MSRLRQGGLSKGDGHAALILQVGQMYGMSEAVPRSPCQHLHSHRALSIPQRTASHRHRAVSIPQYAAPHRLAAGQQVPRKQVPGKQVPGKHGMPADSHRALK